jgi:hypothetical protein
MNEDIKALIHSHEFVKGSWIQNTRNYDGELAKIVEPLLGWRRENASSHDFVTSRGEKVEVKKFKNGNGWLAGSNIAKTPSGVLYLFVQYKNNTVTKLVLSDIESVLDYIEEEDFPLEMIVETSKYKMANLQLRFKCSRIAGKEYVC